jgi:PAS domain-containing protein
MEDNAEEDILHQLKWENKMLKQRVFELEEKLQKAAPSSQSGGGRDSSVLKLLKTKDERLEKSAAELQATVEELEKRNAQLSLWMSTLRLYQEIFENEAAAMIGVNKDGKVILFNRSAPQILGEKFRNALHQPIEAVDFSSFDPTTPALVRTTLAARQLSTHSVKVRDRLITTTVYPLGSEKELTGALAKVTVTPA